MGRSVHGLDVGGGVEDVRDPDLVVRDELGVGLELGFSSPGHESGDVV
jgi:hypothetical protein